MKWNDLSLTEKNQVIKIGIQNGLRDIKSISEAFNTYQEGGKISYIDKHIYSGEENSEIKNLPKL